MEKAGKGTRKEGGNGGDREKVVGEGVGIEEAGKMQVERSWEWRVQGKGS